MMLLANVSPQQVKPLEEAVSENVHLHVAILLKEIVHEFADGHSHKPPTLIGCQVALQLKVCNHNVATIIEHRPGVLTKRLLQRRRLRNKRSTLERDEQDPARC